MPRPHPTYGLNTVEIAPRTEHPMSLKCSACGKISKYDVGRIIVDPDYRGEIVHLSPMDPLRHLAKLPWEKWVSFTGYFVCPSCGSGGPWEFTADAKMAMAAHIIRFISSPKSADIIVGRLTLFDGTAPRTCFDGAVHLNALIEADPGNAYLWNRLGNLFASADENERALPAFEKAHELESRCVETLHSLGDYWFEKGNLPKAASFFHEVLHLCRDGIWRNDRLKENVVQHTLETLLEINQRSGGAIDLMPRAKDSSGRPNGPDAPIVVHLTSIDLGEEGALERLARAFLDGPPSRSRDQHAKWRGGRAPTPLVSSNSDRKVSRNDPCPCGSGKKFKHCCYRR